jgi:uncharacterized protein with FMN-binding domain
VVSVRPTASDHRAGRILTLLISTVTGVVLLFGYRTSTPQPTTTSIVSSAIDASEASGPTSSESATGGTATYTGAAVGTRWGDVQVQITVTDGVIKAVDAVEAPNSNNRDIEINNRALPILAAEALQAQSAAIDTVSGATVTSAGYLGSLQSAIDQAGL